MKNTLTMFKPRPKLVFIPAFITILLALLVIFSGCASIRYTDRFTFFQMADTQFGFFNENKEFSRESRNFEKAIAETNRLKPAFVIVCGDLVNKPGDMAQINEYKRIAATLHPSIKIYNVSGNHDVENTPTPAALDFYRQQFGADRYTFRSGNIFGIVLNSSLIKDPAKAPEEAAAQEAWVRTALEDAKNSGSKNIMVFMHHPFFLNSADEPNQYFNIDIEKRKMFLELFERYKVRQIFAGHYHRNAGGRAGNIEMITTGPVGRPLGSDSSGFRIVNVDGTSISHKYYALDSLPAKLNLQRNQQ
ncbi:MAG: metallophosphoesterase [Daejeonella sp.]|uniref:metallophosphoesterase n=1 Tax=Daejeonella sp. TaxID=2805397 RepID=UPI003C74444C